LKSSKQQAARSKEQGARSKDVFTRNEPINEGKVRQRQERCEDNVRQATAIEPHLVDRQHEQHVEQSEAVVEELELDEHAHRQTGHHEQSDRGVHRRDPNLTNGKQQAAS